MAECEPKILTLEDNPDILCILETAILLKIPKATVIPARTVSQALALAAQELPDVITVDINLPGGKDGWRFLDELSRQPDIRNIPTIVVSALPSFLVQPEAKRRSVPYIDSLEIVPLLPTIILGLLESR